MSDQNKIPPISAADIQKVNEYTKAFDSLRSSISNLSNPISKLDNDLLKLADSINKLNTQNQTLASSGNEVKDTVEDLSSTFTIWGKVINFVKLGVVSLEDALSGGLAILTVFGPEILKWIGNMTKGTTTLSALNKTLKDNKIVMDALNQAKLQGLLNAQQELVHLKLLYTASQDHNIQLSERKKIVSELQSQYPNYFGNMSAEAILNGKSTKSYDDLTKAIIATARARANEDIMVKNQQRQIGNDTKLEKLKSDLTQYTKDMASAQKEYKDVISTPILGGSTLTPGLNTLETTSSDKLAKVRDQVIATKKLIADLQSDSNLLNKQNQALAKSVIDDTEKNGSGVLNIASTIAVRSKQPKPQPADKKQRDSVENLQVMSLDFSKTIELEKKNYDTEQALLDEQLNRKLLSQQQYQEKSEQLLETYHQNIGINVKNFQDVNLADAQKNIQDTVNANQHEATTKKDQHDVDTAILPGDKLAAEKKQLADRYDYEITLATGNADKIKQLEQQKQTDITEIGKKYEQERKDFELQTAQKVSDTAFTILQNSIKSQSNSKIKQLETQKQAELNNTSLTGTQRQAIEAKYKKKENEQKVKAFKDEQKASILQAVINGALAVTKATAQSGMLSAFVIPVIIAETAIQVATIAAQKPPQYAKGGLHYQSDGKGALLSGYSRTDNTNAHLRSGEAVVVSEAMRDPWARNLVSAINVAYGGRDFSATNRGNGYAIGGIFTDGGNSNRYYNQPMNDQKDLANTIAYQMINNFPPVYVDVKDINNQQNILAQTMNRVNL